jgi:ketosteroid isomerase-like protein
MRSNSAPRVDSATTTKETIEGYFRSLKGGQGWEAFFSENILFTSFTSPVKQLKGKAAVLLATKGFYGMVRSFEVRELLVEGDKACARTGYWLQPPAGDAFHSDVAEIFTVVNGRIEEFSIYFDSAAFPR